MKTLQGLLMAATLIALMGAGGAGFECKGPAGGGTTTPTGGTCGEAKCQSGEICLTCGSTLTCQKQGTVCCDPGTGAGGTGPVVCTPDLMCIKCGTPGCVAPGSTCCNPGSGAGGSAPLICPPKQACGVGGQSCVPL